MNCPKCQLAFNKLRKPMVLSCGHTFCESCLVLSEVNQCKKCGNKSKPAINFALFEQITKQNLKNIDKYIKICLFGNMDVGKSSILRRLVDDQFQFNTNPTIGIDFKYLDKEIEGKMCRFQIWDSAGQERYRAVSSNHLKGSDIVLLVYDVSNSHEQNGLTYWIGEIQNYANHSNIIVVGNKIDLLQEKKIKEQQKQPLLASQINTIQKLGWSHLKISCLSNQNIDKLWQILIKKSKISKGITAEQRQKSVILGSQNNVKNASNTSKLNSSRGNNQKSCC